MILPQYLTLVNPHKFEVWNAKKQLNTQIAKKLARAGLHARARRVEECADQFSLTLCPECGHYEISRAVLCHDRLCPVCNWRLSLKRFANMMKLVSAILDKFQSNRWSFMTLTVKNCPPYQLHETLRKMSEAYNRMRQRKTFKNAIAGWARTVEVTYNAEKNELHPHFHVLIMWELNADPLKDGARLLNNWQASCRDDLIISYKAQNIEEIDGSSKEVTQEELLTQHTADDLTRSILETFKYTQKASDLLEMPLETFRAYADNMASIRAVSFGGAFKEYAKLLKIPEEETAAAGEDFTICPNCKNPELAKAVYKWAMSEHSYLRIDPTTSAVVGDPVKSVNKRQKRQRCRTN